jgi:hypothetical protein
MFLFRFVLRPVFSWENIPQTRLKLLYYRCRQWFFSYNGLMDRRILNFGYYSAFTAFIATVCYDILQILQVVGVLKPPVDGMVLYGASLLIPVPFVLAMLALHYTVPQERRIWTHGALLFSAIYAAYVSVNYVVQLATVIPMRFQGMYDKIILLDQTPHSLFWDIDALGYIFMGIATFIAAWSLDNRGVQGWTRKFFIANGLADPIIAIVYFYPTFSYTLLLLGVSWVITASGSMFWLALYFRSKRKT